MKKEFKGFTTKNNSKQTKTENPPQKQKVMQEMGDKTICHIEK